MFQEKKEEDDGHYAAFNMETGSSSGPYASYGVMGHSSHSYYHPGSVPEYSYGVSHPPPSDTIRRRGYTSIGTA